MLTIARVLIKDNFGIKEKQKGKNLMVSPAKDSHCKIIIIIKHLPLLCAHYVSDTVLRAFVPFVIYITLTTTL